MVRPLVSVSSPADALIRRHYKAWDGELAVRGQAAPFQRGERGSPPPQA